MKRYFSLLSVAILFLFGLIGMSYAESTKNAKGFAICDRIEKQGICEEYRLDILSTSDKRLIIKYCESDKRCPDENRIGRCVRFKDPDGVVFDKYYYRGAAKKPDWEPSYIEETCINSGGKYEDG